MAEPQVEQGEKDTTQFLDFTVVDGTEVDETALKRKRDEVDNNSEDSDINNSFELVYETPLGKIGYRGNKITLVTTYDQHVCIVNGYSYHLVLKILYHIGRTTFC